ncbi:SdiA-regulated domain-containing protein, partial [Salmonella enterica]
LPILASDDRDTLWIVSEPNLFYRFTRMAAS